MGRDALTLRPPGVPAMSWAQTPEDIAGTPPGRRLHPSAAVADTPHPVGIQVSAFIFRLGRLKARHPYPTLGV